MEPTRKTMPLADILTDVSIREGSQQEIDLRYAGIDTKLEFMSLAAGSGVRRIELTAFAPGPWFADAEALAQKAAGQIPDTVSLRALYFNTQGLDTMLRHPAFLREGIFLTAATARYREKNYGQKSADHAKIKMKRMIAAFNTYGLRFDTLVLSTAWGACNDASPAENTLDYLAGLLAAARQTGFPVRTITLADTMGCAGPEMIAGLVEAVKNRWPDVLVCTHLHPAPGSEEACIEAAMAAGIDRWEASWCGLGGSPMADNAGGNLDIRRLIRVYNRRRMDHGFEEEAVLRIVHFLKNRSLREIPDLPL